MSWYDELGEQTIVMLKENTTPFGLCPEWEKDLFRDIFKKDPASLQVYFGATNNWGTADLDDIYLEGVRTYRLNPDWKRPEEKSEKKEGHWEYCEVYVYSGEYRFVRSNDQTYLLHYAFNLPGFGGIEFEEKPGEWFTQLMFWDTEECWLFDEAGTHDKKMRPATPKRVRFWVEG